MKIWIVSHYAIPPTQAGSTRHYSLARHLIQRGHEVTIIAANFGYMMREQTVSTPHLQLQEFDGVPFVLIPTPPYQSNIKRVWNMLVFMMRVWGGQAEKVLPSAPDVIYASTPHHFAGLAGLRLARRHHIPFVLEVRDPWPLSLIEIGKMSRYHPLVLVLGGLEKHLYHSAHWIVSLLPTAADHIVQHGGKREKITWIPNGADLSQFPEPQPVSSQDGTFTVMYAGQHSLANDPDCILDAAKLLAADGYDRVKFRMVGGGIEKPRLIRRAEDEGLKDMSFQPPVAKSAIGAVLSEADAFIASAKDVPIRTMGVSLNKAFDYLAAARPVIWSIKSTNNIVEEAQAGISVPPENPRALADAIKQLAAMPASERWNMGLRGRRYVEEHYDFEKLALRLEEILYSVVGPARRRDD